MEIDNEFEKIRYMIIELANYRISHIEQINDEILSQSSKYYIYHRLKDIESIKRLKRYYKRYYFKSQPQELHDVAEKIVNHINKVLNALSEYNFQDRNLIFTGYLKLADDIIRNNHE